MKVPSFSYCSAPAAHAARTTGHESFVRGALLVVGLAILLIPATASAQNAPIVQTTNNQSMAFARYIAWLDARDPFTESGPVMVAIEATLPGLDKQASLLGIHDIDESERSQYTILEREGDAVVFERVITPYLVAQREAEDQPLSSVIINPRNYKFRYAGQVEAGDNAAAYVFRIRPKKNRAGLIRGELWIDPATGAPFLLTGYLAKTTSTSIRSINIVREITSVDGCPCARTTHMVIETQPVGRADLTIIEVPLRLPDQQPKPSPVVSGQNMRSKLNVCDAQPVEDQ